MWTFPHIKKAGCWPSFDAGPDHSGTVPHISCKACMESSALGINEGMFLSITDPSSRTKMEVLLYEFISGIFWLIPVRTECSFEVLSHPLQSVIRGQIHALKLQYLLTKQFQSPFSHFGTLMANWNAHIFAEDCKVCTSVSFHNLKVQSHTCFTSTPALFLCTQSVFML